MILRSPTGTVFYSEFHADSEYAIYFKKYLGQKNGLTATYHFVAIGGGGSFADRHTPLARFCLEWRIYRKFMTLY